MKKLIIIFYALLLLISSSRLCFAQNDYGKVWLQGDPLVYRTTFEATGPVNVIEDTSGVIHASLGHSNICDSLGNLILFSNSYSIMKADLDTMEGGYKVCPEAWWDFAGNLGANAQASIFLPMGNSKYYMIGSYPSNVQITNYQNNQFYRACHDLMYLNEIDMKANNGVGKVVRRKVPILENKRLSLSQMTACRHGDGKSWWLFKQGYDTNTVYKFLLTKDSVYGPFIQEFSDPLFSSNNICGQSCFSKDGSLYASTARAAGKVFVADFDRCSGMLSNPRVYTQKPIPVYATQTDSSLLGYDNFTESLAISPNGRFVYVGGFGGIRQLDLQDPDTATQWEVVAGQDTAKGFREYSSIGLGPDDKLYIGNWHGFSNAMSVLNKPDEKGLASEFCPKCLRFDMHHNIASVKQPPNMPNYKLGAATPICWPLGVEEVPEQTALSVYPNPANGSFTIAYQQSSQFILTDVMGKRCMAIALPSDKNKIEVDAKQLPSGVYFWHQERGGVLVNSGKLVIVQE